MMCTMVVLEALLPISMTSMTMTMMMMMMMMMRKNSDSDVSMSEYRTMTLDTAATSAVRQLWLVRDQVTSDAALAEQLEAEEFDEFRNQRDWDGIREGITDSEAVATQLEEEERRAFQAAEAERRAAIASREQADAATAAAIAAADLASTPAAAAGTLPLVALDASDDNAAVAGPSGGSADADADADAARRRKKKKRRKRERRGFYNPEDDVMATVDDSQLPDLAPPATLVDSSDDADFEVLRPPPELPDSDDDDGAPERSKSKAELELEKKLEDQRQLILDWRFLFFKKHSRPALFADMTDSKKVRKMLAKYRSILRKLIKKRKC
ncbi:uncharacterized protein AMSG_09688 [Thecamonas trahens ATCC 50062]|uniref:Uncharacterized protein n=1 Tax=Thecamonas trahens ATCC 50062 TaxID=461836 RepID=A0A0L0DRF3_THETB|nr:hypothetical protein AMSG_09688 [Thecamonas trahens ATCC 50062]KNC54028.1 hypothetical protein AMSG_09688 [Thecamonas trahens ATCC 50062]|eukprot:XP_013754041.1 hypothetical protein AMSG_09688 [Thecamonas trahens ATCC 50062]